MLIILDRDGVINEDSDQFIKSPAEWCAIPGSLKAIAVLKKIGHTVVVATNQSGVGRGYFTPATLNAIHQKMQNQLAEYQATLDGIYICPHHPDDHCLCRKPKTGLLEQIKADFPEQFASSLLIGDSLRDIEAAQAMAIGAILVLTGKGEKTANQLKNIEKYKDLAAAVAFSPIFH